MNNDERKVPQCLNPNTNTFEYVEGVAGSISTNVPAFSISTSIMRSTTTTAYSNGQIILGNGLTSLPAIDFSTTLNQNMANRKIAITGVFVISDNGINTPFAGSIDLFNIANPSVSISLSDYAIFTPTANALTNNFVNKIDNITDTNKYGSVSNMSWKSEILRKATLDANGKLYFALVNGSSYTPKNGEIITLVFKFYVLN